MHFIALSANYVTAIESNSTVSLFSWKSANFGSVQLFADVSFLHHYESFCNFLWWK